MIALELSADEIIILIALIDHAFPTADQNINNDLQQARDTLHAALGDLGAAI